MTEIVFDPRQYANDDTRARCRVIVYAAMIVGMDPMTIVPVMTAAGLLVAVRVEPDRVPQIAPTIEECGNYFIEMQKAWRATDRIDMAGAVNAYKRHADTCRPIRGNGVGATINRYA